MKRIDSKKKVLLGIAAATLIVISVLCYWPFVQMDNIDAEAYWGNHFDGSMHDRIQVQLTRFQLYPNCWFIHKGDMFTDIPLLDKNGIKYKMNIKFNWDNSVTISKATTIYNLHVNRIEIRPQLYPFSDDDYPYKLHETEDSLFSVVAMYDEKKNEIDIYRQKKTMPYNGKRIGFRLKIDGKVLVTGAKERFDY